jgi:hypothetical protein
MGNEGTFELTLLGVDAQPASDPSTLVSFLRTTDGQEIGRVKRSFPPERRFPLPAFPQERAITCQITPQRYRLRDVGIFTLTDGETIRRGATVFRIPEKWKAAFVKWADLPDALQSLRDTLDVSPTVRVKGGQLLGQFVKGIFDDVDTDGSQVTVLDADIDENGKLMAHLADLFKHRFTGGTHPFDIHEYLVLEDKNRSLGYDLV